MTLAGSQPQSSRSIRSVALGVTLLMIVLLGGAGGALAAAPKVTNSSITSGYVGVPYSFQITSDQVIVTWGASPLPAGLTVNTSTGLISGTPTAAGTTSVTLSVTNGNGTGTKVLPLTINGAVFAGFRLPDFQTPSGANKPRLMLQMGATDPTGSHPFNATLEVDASDPPHTTPVWVPYNRFVGIDDSASWITSAPLPVRDAAGTNGAPQAFSAAQLTAASTPPAVYMKADPRATRFGIFQIDTNLTTLNSRIVLPPWPRNDPSVPNGFGGTVTTTWPGPVEHAPNRFSSAAYYPATFSINGPTDARDTATTIYPDNDGVTRAADAIYPVAASHTGESTPYTTTPTTGYHPIMLNRPFRNVGELGYVFRDLPWKTLDFFSDKSADAGLLDIFTTNQAPTMAAGSVNLNTTQAADLQTVFARAILDEINSTTINPTGTGDTDAPTLASRVVSATNPNVNPAAIPIQNKSELLTRANLPTTILPPASNDNQAVKARREVVARAASCVSQTRVWNLLFDVVAQTGHFKPNATSLQNDFVAEGEEHYWVHVAIDRFTGQVLDKQIEKVKE
jgi:PKD repeat protein